uniref:Uncharacterized protein n=1 Tax=Ditylenchus dipsaci TaxID=166011 RepID=A0A915CUP8_9BILA
MLKSIEGKTLANKETALSALLHLMGVHHWSPVCHFRYATLDTKSEIVLGNIVEIIAEHAASICAPKDWTNRSENNEGEVSTNCDVNGCKAELGFGSKAVDSSNLCEAKSPMPFPRLFATKKATSDNYYNCKTDEDETDSSNWISFCAKNILKQNNGYDYGASYVNLQSEYSWCSYRFSARRHEKNTKKCVSEILRVIELKCL